VLVDVETGSEELECYRGAGFDHFQIHAGLSLGLASLATWSGLVGRERLWMAPRFGPSDGFPEAVIEFADTVLVDTFHKDQFGGTGETGDWARFAELKNRYIDTRFVLAGGLNPLNVAKAIAATGTDFVDVNSGVESEPGIKDPKKLHKLFEILK